VHRGQWLNPLGHKGRLQWQTQNVSICKWLGWAQPPQVQKLVTILVENNKLNLCQIYWRKGKFYFLTKG